MSLASQQILGQTDNQFGFAGSVLRSAANDGSPTAMIGKDTRPNITPPPITQTNNSDKILSTAVALLNRIDRTMKAQLTLTEKIRADGKEAKLEQSHALAANDNTYKKIEKQDGDSKGGMSALIALLTKGLGGGALATGAAVAAPWLAAGAGAVAAGKGLYDNRKKIGEGVEYAGETVVTGAKTAYKTAKNLIDTGLGFVSGKYESNGKTSTISTGKGDAGGKSYGKYQLASKTGTLTRYINQSKYKSEFAGLAVGSAAFDAKWRQLAKDDAGFGKDQHDFIGKTHYIPALKHAKELGYPTDDRRIQEMVWSGSVQHGKINRILDTTAKNIDVKNAPVEDVIKTFYADRTAYAGKNVKNARVRQGVVDRYAREERDVLSIKPNASAKQHPVGEKTAASKPAISASKMVPKNVASLMQPTKSIPGITKMPTTKPARLQQATPAAVAQAAPQARSKGGAAPKQVAAKQSTPLTTPKPSHSNFDMSYNMYFG